MIKLDDKTEYINIIPSEVQFNHVSSSNDICSVNCTSEGVKGYKFDEESFESFISGMCKQIIKKHLE